MISIIKDQGPGPEMPTKQITGTLITISTIPKMIEDILEVINIKEKENIAENTLSKGEIECKTEETKSMIEE